MSQAEGAGSAMALPETTDKSTTSIDRAARVAIEARIEWLIGLLDENDEDGELEPDDEDCCCALEDFGSAFSNAPYYAAFGPGDPEDAEDEPWRGLPLPKWGADQSTGPVNESEFVRAWHRRELGLTA